MENADINVRDYLTSEHDCVTFLFLMPGYNVKNYNLCVF